MSEWDYENEPIVGHHVAVRVKPLTKLQTVLDDVADELDIERNTERYIQIEVGDVAWDEPQRVTLSEEDVENIYTELIESE